MKFLQKNKTQAFLTLFLILSSSLLTDRVLALSGDPNQNFVTTPTTPLANWSASSGTGAYQIQLNPLGPPPTATAEPFADPNDTYNNPNSPNGIIGSTSPKNTSVTITYTDPLPTGSQNYLKLDIYTSGTGRDIGFYVVDSTNTTYGEALGQANVLTNCWTPNPTPVISTSNGITAANWNTVFLDLTSFTGLVQPIKSAYIVISDSSSMNLNTDHDYVLIDNLRGDSILSCLTATPTPTMTSTSTATGTPTPLTNSATPTFTTTYTYTGTQTSTVTNTVTPTQTSTNTYTPSSTPTYTPSETSTATPTYTSSPIATATYTSTPFITSTPTVTSTSTPAACQPYVYPNPMDFTIAHNLANLPTNACDNPQQKCVIFSCIPIGSTMKIYTVSLALVRVFDTTSLVTSGGLPSGTGMIVWDGTTNGTSYVSSGLYFYVINGPNGNTFGKFAISKSINGP